MRSGAEEWEVGSVKIPAWIKNHGWQYTKVIRDHGFDASLADVILRPDIDTALNTVDVTEIWDGEIIFKDIPVQRPGAATRPGGS